jgi:hypothetical protein
MRGKRRDRRALRRCGNGGEDQACDRSDLSGYEQTVSFGE